MKLSFVIPAHNEEAYLADCIESILRESAGLEDMIEIIVVDNSSTDNTSGTALLYPGVRLVHESRKGLPYARQAGFLASSGSLICNVDADSRLTPGWIPKVIETFQQHPQLVSLSGPLVYYDLTSRQRNMVNVFYFAAWLTYVVNKYILRVGAMVQGGNFVVTRSALERIGGYDVSISFYGEDTDLARRLHEIGPVRFTFDLKMFSSARRLKHEGMFKIAVRYAINYFWTIFFKRPFTREHIDIREQTQA